MLGKKHPARKTKKMPESVKQRADRQIGNKNKPKRNRKNIYKPLSLLREVAKKEYHPISLPQSNKLGRFLGKRVNLIPSYLKNAWKELTQVTWPKPKEAFRLTLAVMIFALIFAIFVQILGYGFDKLFKALLLR